MQDVFPVAFNFVRGEQPSSEKLTKWVKLEDSALDRVVTAIGDPWGYQAHIGGGGTVYTLSPEQLAQTSIARIAGPSDYIGPYGNALMEAMPGASLSVTLAVNQNMWTIGFPLITVVGGNTISPDSDVSTDLVSLDLDTEVTILKASDLSAHSSFVLVQRKDTPDLLAVSGDYCIDAVAGVIYSYDIITDAAIVNFPNDNLCYLGAGAPWTTHNVIPSWSDGTNIGCTVDLVSPGVYSIALPSILSPPRGTTEALGRLPVGTSSNADTGVTIDSGAPGKGASYRLPYSLTANLSAGEDIPVGFILFWHNPTSSIVSLTTFKYQDEHSLTVTCPTLSGSFPNTTAYRIIVTGCSLAEQVGYLSCVLRDAHFAGLTSGGQIPKTLAYLPPLSHDNLTNRFSIGYIGDIGNISGVETGYQFRESSYPTNIHPQYLHRSGYMSDDHSGNSANAMRGDIVFTSTDAYKLDADTVGCGKETFGIYFGGYQDTAGNSNNPSLRFKGGVDTPWVNTPTGPASKIGFGIEASGAVNQTGQNYFGALTYTPWYGTPLFLQGSYSGTVAGYQGAVLGFDMGQDNEMNYIKLLDGIRTSGTKDPANMLVNIGHTTPVLGMTPSLTTRLSSDQMREFRFRGGPYIPTAINDSPGGTGTEFAKYFVSPGIVGADFINVYSNAIFFSETGDGQKTSFTTRGENWLDNNTNQPVGLYYNPYHLAAPAQDAKFSFVTRELAGSCTPFEVGYNFGLHSVVAGASTVSAVGGLTLSGTDVGTVLTSDGRWQTTARRSSYFNVTSDNATLSFSTTHGDLNITQGNSGHSLNVSAAGTLALAATGSGLASLGSQSGNVALLAPGANILLTTALAVKVKAISTDVFMGLYRVYVSADGTLYYRETAGE